MTTIYWTILILVIAVLGICGSILSRQNREVYRSKKVLEDSLWVRRNKIPLLLEVLLRAGISTLNRDEIMGIRSTLMNDPLTLADTMEEEKRLTGLVTDLFRKNVDEPFLKSEPLFFVLESEFKSDLVQIRTALNDYNFSLEKFKTYCKMPWFKIFGFFFESRSFESAQII